jgi:hypothetical protein
MENKDFIPQRGWIGFVQRDTLIGHIIEEAEEIEHGEEKFTATHVFYMIEKDGILSVIEALLEGVKVTNWLDSEYYKESDCIFKSWTTDIALIDKSIEFALKQEGKPYWILGTGFFQPIHVILAKLGLEKWSWWGDTSKDLKWYCSQLVCRSVDFALDFFKLPRLFTHPDSNNPQDAFDNPSLKFEFYLKH